MNSLKTFFYHIYFSMALIAEPETTFTDRIISFFYWLCALGPVVYISDVLSEWFFNYQGFAIAVVAFVLANMAIGSWTHHRRKTFDVKILLRKTWIMIWVLFVTYFTIEILISIAGNNYVVMAFRVVLQMTTLIYPLSKILKNIFIISKGEHPPEWIMKRIYNFQENGDLRAFLEVSTPREKEIHHKKTRL